LQEKTIKQIIASNISKLRKKAGFKSQEEFGKQIGVSKTTVWNYENGVNFFPLEKVPLVIKALKCSLKDLFHPIFDELPEDKELQDLFYKLQLIKEDKRSQQILTKLFEIIDIWTSEVAGTTPPQKRAEGRE
jgi:transcriptional regulator with XRE-family HTH domain